MSFLQMVQLAVFSSDVYTRKWLWTHDLAPTFLISGSNLCTLGGGVESCTASVITEPESVTETAAINTVAERYNKL